ncbi:MAG TPA: 30S ribosomal protein S17, partial [Candidatus Coatesbacteria bacterium]|nr:30S ribosomal protein S17 [Candidatus Coatesbacteria bacterium]
GVLVHALLGRAGDLVLIEETRPLSKRKNWRVVEIVERAAAAEERVDQDPASPLGEPEG